MKYLTLLLIPFFTLASYPSLQEANDVLTSNFERLQDTKYDEYGRIESKVSYEYRFFDCRNIMITKYEKAVSMNADFNYKYERTFGIKDLRAFELSPAGDYIRVKTRTDGVFERRYRADASSSWPQYQFVGQNRIEYFSVKYKSSQSYLAREIIEAIDSIYYNFCN